MVQLHHNDAANDAAATSAVGRVVRRVVRDVAPLGSLATRATELRVAARRAIARAASASAVPSSRVAATTPASDAAVASISPISLSRAYNPLRHGACFAAMIPGDSAVEQVITSGLFSTLNIYNTLLIGRLILTWFPSPPRQIVYPLATLCDPYLNLFRGIIPPIGGTIDLSPILAFTVLNVFTNTAAALPAEVDAEGNLIRSPTASERVGSVAKKAWARRMAASKAKKEEKEKAAAAK